MRSRCMARSTSGRKHHLLAISGSRHSAHQSTRKSGLASVIFLALVSLGGSKCCCLMLLICSPCYLHALRVSETRLEAKLFVPKLKASAHLSFSGWYVAITVQGAQAGRCSISLAYLYCPHKNYGQSNSFIIGRSQPASALWHRRLRWRKIRGHFRCFSHDVLFPLVKWTKFTSHNSVSGELGQVVWRGC